MSDFWQRPIAPPLFRKLREQSKMKVFLALSLLLTSITQTSATCASTTLDFEDLAAGDTHASSMGVSIKGSANGAMIFDTANPTGDDFDLAGPYGKVLIVFEDGDTTRTPQVWLSHGRGRVLGQTRGR